MTWDLNAHSSGRLKSKILGIVYIKPIECSKVIDKHPHFLYVWKNTQFFAPFHYHHQLIFLAYRFDIFL